MANGTSTLKLYDTHSRQKQDFVPLDANNVRMYACGPTVYDFAHIGNARPVIVFDVLFRLLRHVYGESHVTYVRNITDVDDKINARATRDFPDLPLNDAIRKVTEKTANQFHADVKRLGCLEPTVEPRATDFILPRADGKTDMVSLIQTLLDKGHAYVAEGREGLEVLFDTAAMPNYGQLSKRPLDEQKAGARIAVEAHKKTPADFVLWKQSSTDEPGWNAEFVENGEPKPIYGRPGWHIECSAMSAAYLGEVFDIHGGGLDLIFPHHENELAQSCCAHGTDRMANIWMHNGFLQVEGKKMSKSDGNFITINELLDTEKFGDRKWPGAALRLVMLKTHYRSPIDWTQVKLEEAERELNIWSKYSWNQSHLARYEHELQIGARIASPMPSVVEALSDDLNTPLAISRILEHRGSEPVSYETMAEILDSLSFFGILNVGDLALYSSSYASDTSIAFITERHELVRDYRVALANNNPRQAQTAVQSLANLGIRLVEKDRGDLTLEDVREDKADELAEKIQTRLDALNAKDFDKADAIRAELLEQGIQLMDTKDPDTGERKTKWEVKR